MFSPTIEAMQSNFFLNKKSLTKKKKKSSPFFLLTNNYWKCLKKKIRRRNSSEAIGSNLKNENESQPDQTVSLEKERVLENAMKQIEVKGLRISRLCKTYSYYPFGIKSSEDKEALKELYLEVDEGELLGVLGHNGAGKSTMIGVLTGILEPTAGTAEILNYNIGSDMDDVYIYYFYTLLVIYKI